MYEGRTLREVHAVAYGCSQSFLSPRQPREVVLPTGEWLSMFLSVRKRSERSFSSHLLNFRNGVLKAKCGTWGLVSINCGDPNRLHGPIIQATGILARLQTGRPVALKLEVEQSSSRP